MIIKIFLMYNVVMERKTVKLLGFDIDTFSFEEALNYVKQRLLDNERSSHIVTINPEIIETARKDSDLRRILNEADLVIPDGIGVKLGLKIKGENVDRIAGIEFAHKLIEESAKIGIPIGFLGAKQEVLEKACENIKREIPNANIVFAQDGYFEFNVQVLDVLQQIKPKILFVAMGAPKQEEFIYSAKHTLHSTVMIGVGGSFDVWAGHVQRAPKIWQKLGLEWLYRTLKQPERFKRIFPTLPNFICSIIKEQYSK